MRLKYKKNNVLAAVLITIAGCTAFTDDPLQKAPAVLQITAPASTFQDDAVKVRLAATSRDIDFIAIMVDDGGSIVSNPFLETFNDDGAGADASAGDNIYTGRLNTSQLIISPSAFFILEITTRIGPSRESATIAINNSSAAFNQPPELSGVEIPDTLTIDSLNTVLFEARVTVSDPNGPQDIKSVTLFSAQSGTPIALFDDGSPLHADDLSGDGIYSEILSLPSDTEPGIFVFRFQAIDRIGAISDEVQKEVVVVE